MTPDVYLDRMVLSLSRLPGADRAMLATMLRAMDILGRLVGAQLAVMRNTGEPVQVLAAQVKAQVVLIGAFREACDILAARWMKVPRRHRPHYTPEQRFRILQVQRTLGLSARKAAALFVVDEGTVGRWAADTAADPKKETVGSLVKPVPPVRRMADVVRHVVQRMGELGVVGNGLIARMVTRAGWRLSKRSAGRMRKEARVPDPLPKRSARKNGGVVAARLPLHVLMLDITEIPALFKVFTVKLVLCIDVWSRMPLGARVLPDEPTAAEVSELFADVVKRHGNAPHLVTDQGAQLTAAAFRQTVASRGTRQRFGAIGRTGSIAIIERLFRTLKDALRQPLRPDVTFEDHQRRIGRSLLWYSWHRPHMALDGATPAEVYYGLRPGHLDARSPPRGRRGQRCAPAPFELVLLDDDVRLPALLPRAA